MIMENCDLTNYEKHLIYIILSNDCLNTIDKINENDGKREFYEKQLKVKSDILDKLKDWL